jgi:hypothetical protein
MELSRRTAGRLAWSVVALAAVAAIAGETIAAAAGRSPDWFVFAILVFPLVGALVVSQQPRNAVGWVMLALGGVVVVGGLVGAYAVIGLDLRPGSLPEPGVALALTEAIWVPVIGLIGTFLILLFPDGKLPSPRWRPWAWFCALAMVLSYAAILFQPATFAERGFPDVSNPFGIQAIEPIGDALLTVLLSIPIAIVGCAVALIRRFRRSQGRTRLQLKWLAASAAVVAFSYGLGMAANVPFTFTGSEAPEWMGIFDSLSIIPFFFIPMAMGIAITRHRLYDIDVIINRALVYGTLTVTLTIAYVIAIAAIQVIARPLAGESQLAVAGSTLAVAALFRPARRRIQGFIDRRFYRSKFDATKTLEEFSARLRDEVNLETLSADLLAVVDSTMSPAHRSLWLREQR